MQNKGDVRRSLMICSYLSHSPYKPTKNTRKRLLRELNNQGKISKKEIAKSRITLISSCFERWTLRLPLLICNNKKLINSNLDQRKYGVTTEKI